MTFSISATSPAIEVDVSEGDRAILQIYTVYDTKNTGRDEMAIHCCRLMR